MRPEDGIGVAIVQGNDAPKSVGSGTAATIPPQKILLCLIAACLMLQPLSTDLYLASLPDIGRYFAVSPAAVQQTLALFVVGFGGGQLLVGPLSDRYGRRPVLLIGLTFYVVASIVCALADSISVLIAARFVQGAGCCTAVVIARAIVRDAYAPEEGAHTIANANAILAFAPLLGPVAGSHLHAAFGWRAAFILFAVLGLLLSLVVWSYLRETICAINPVALRLDSLRQTHGRILGNPTFWAYALPGALSYTSIFVFISGASFALIGVLKLPAANFGYAWAAGVSGYLIGAFACKRLLRSKGIERVMSWGGVIAASAGVTFAAAVATGLHHWSVVVVSLFMTMLAHGINWPCAQVGSVAPFPLSAATAAGLLGCVAMLAASLVGVWVGISQDGTLSPMSLIAAVVGIAVFVAGRLLAPRRRLRHMEN